MIRPSRVNNRPYRQLKVLLKNVPGGRVLPKQPSLGRETHKRARAGLQSPLYAQ
jgi:hypothetical protein